MSSEVRSAAAPLVNSAGPAGTARPCTEQPGESKPGWGSACQGYRHSCLSRGTDPACLQGPSCCQLSMTAGQAGQQCGTGSSWMAACFHCLLTVNGFISLLRLGWFWAVQPSSTGPWVMLLYLSNTRGWRSLSTISVLLSSHSVPLSFLYEFHLTLNS